MYRGYIHDGHTHLKPNLVTLTTLLDAWAQAGEVERAWTTFGCIRQLHDWGVLPTGQTSTTYHIMMTCLLKQSDCAVKVDTLLQEMKRNPNTQPGMRWYACTLQAWLLTPDGLDRAVELSQDALDVYSTDSKRSSYLSMQKSSSDVKSIILAFCTAGHPVHAQNFLFGVCKLARENRSPPPNENVFRALVDAWRKSEDPEAELRTEYLLERMKQLRMSRGHN
jgi:hypothetical protein